MNAMLSEHDYPEHGIGVVVFSGDLAALYRQPRGLIEEPWPPVQLNYLGNYLAKLDCKTVVSERHYVDRDYIDDVALFYSRSLRSYPNYCHRLHFFSEVFDEKRWREFATSSSNRGSAEKFLQQSYLGFSVVRPLPGCPVGRTVLRTFPERTQDGLTREFGAVREYVVHLAGFKLSVMGLAFQQQDRGVSACATTALWSSMHRVAHAEGLAVPTPAHITEAASRYVLREGRSLPSDGLTLDQVCEAIRGAGLAPLVIRGLAPEHARAQLLGYTSSGFAPVLAIQARDSSLGHAVCGVGVKRGEITPPDDPKFHYRDAATAVKGIYVHDDRLGPYASVDLYPYTAQGVVKTGLLIRWPGEATPAEDSVLTALIVPVPLKLRLTIARMRSLGIGLADAIGHRIFPEFDRLVTLNCRYRIATAYRAVAPSFGLSDDGLYLLTCELVLSRYVGVIELSAPDGALCDILLDATETEANPSVLACVKRRALTPEGDRKLEALAANLAARCIL